MTKIGEELGDLPVVAGLADYGTGEVGDLGTYGGIMLLSSSLGNSSLYRVPELDRDYDCCLWRRPRHSGWTLELVR